MWVLRGRFVIKKKFDVFWPRVETNVMYGTVRYMYIYVVYFLAKNDSGFTPLMIAVQSGNLEAIKLLISHKADVNAQNGYAG